MAPKHSQEASTMTMIYKRPYADDPALVAGRATAKTSGVPAGRGQPGGGS
jgi:hypothetical protein